MAKCPMQSLHWVPPQAKNKQPAFERQYDWHAVKEASVPVPSMMT
jgi:hypothetical protein